MSLESITKNIEAAIGYRENYETDIAKKDLANLLRVVRCAQKFMKKGPFRTIAQCVADGDELDSAIADLDR